MTLEQLATDALDQIAKQPKGHVLAARKGICAAHRYERGTRDSTAKHIVFRRKATRVVVELWEQFKVTYYVLPPELEERAAKMLDTL